MKTTLRLAILGVASVLALSACNGAQTKAIDTGLTTENMNPSELLLLKTGTWITRSIHDSNGMIYSGKDAFVSRLAGVTRYHNDGTFRSVSMDSALVLEGNWTISDDGKTLNLIGVGKDGRPGFNIVAPVLKLNNTEFAYRVYPNPNNRNQYFDVNLGPASIDQSKILNRASSTNPNSLSN